MPLHRKPPMVLFFSRIQVIPKSVHLDESLQSEAKRLSHSPSLAAVIAAWSRRAGSSQSTSRHPVASGEGRGDISGSPPLGNTVGTLPELPQRTWRFQAPKVAGAWTIRSERREKGRSPHSSRFFGRKIQPQIRNREQRTENYCGVNAGAKHKSSKRQVTEKTRRARLLKTFL